MTAPGCRAPATCPVPDPAAVDLRRLRLARLPAGSTWVRVHEDGYAAAALNDSGRGDTRFAPLDGRAHTYLGRSRTVALLETTFHDVHETTPRVITVATDLTGRQLSHVNPTDDLAVLDLRDEQLTRLGLDRGQLVATTAAHYPCTRAWAVHLLGRRVGGVAPVGMLWHSRVAELARDGAVLLDDLLAAPTAEVCVLYDGAALDPTAAAPQPLDAGQGRLLVDEVAEQLDAVIV